MTPQDVANISQWLQQLLDLLQDTHTQLMDMRNENKQINGAIKAVSDRLDRKDTDIISMIGTLRTQVDMMRGEVTSTKSTVEGRVGHVESKIDDLKSSIHEVRNIVR